MTIPRLRALRRVEAVLRANPACALLGPRQCGKTTLARQVAARRVKAHYFDLESPADRARLAEPELALGRLEGLVVLDEIQRAPSLLEVLRPLSDRSGTPARFLVLGSAAPEVVRGASESLAGRVGFVDLGGLDLEETGAESWRRLWLRGGFPRSYLAESEAASLAWRRDFVRTFLERDMPQLGVRIPAEALRRFWTMVAHVHGGIWTGADVSRSLGLSQPAVRRYLDLLAGAYVLRVLPPWHENLTKRQVRAPKVYVRDSGLLHVLLGVESAEVLESHPSLGASWEGFALEQALSRLDAREAYFWATHAGAELDLLFIRGGKRYGVEFKYAAAPAMTRSLHAALEDLKLERAWIVHPGEQRFPVHAKVEAVGPAGLMRELAKP